MIISVAKEGEEASLLASKPGPVFLVEQVNARPLAKQSSFGRVVGNKVQAFVPACVPTVTSQVPEKEFASLASCYENTILAAAKAGARTIAVRQLGVGRKVNVVLNEGGQMVNHDLWGDMFWTVAKSSLAARFAVQAASPKVADGIEVVFVVPPEAHAEWDATMAFG